MDYRQMYYFLVGKVDDAITELENSADIAEGIRMLTDALNACEDMYVDGDLD